jgi:hypothetical protein
LKVAYLPISIKILPNIGLMYARFEGHIAVPDATAAFQAYMDHEDHAPGQKHLVDMSRVTSFEADYPELLQFLANMDADTQSTRTHTLFVYYATSELTRSMSQAAVNAWSASAHIVVRVLETEQSALDVLGLPYSSFAQMLDEGENVTSSLVSS